MCLRERLSEGLGILGFGEQMKRYPCFFDELFVHGGDSLSGVDVIKLLEFPASMSADETSTQTNLEDFLMIVDKEDVENFLIFVTGAPRLPNFGMGKSKVKFDNTTAIFSSTCLESVTFPRSFPDKEAFISSLNSVINTVTKSFNCI